MAVVRQLRKDDVIGTGGRLEALGLKCHLVAGGLRLESSRNGLNAQPKMLSPVTIQQSLHTGD
jgi:hypothetical protein